MLVIGELINGMYTQIGKAIQSKDKAVIQKVAKDQESAGADMLDVNTGPASSNPVEDMKWLIEVIQEVSNLPLALDSTKPKVIEEGLKLVKVKAMINSTIADEERLGALIPLAKQYGASIIGLTMDKKGPPQDRHKRSELAAMIVSACMDAGMDLNDLYIDPIILPVNVAQPQVTEVLETIRDIKLLSDPSPKTVVGLSNVSQGTKDRNLINRTFLIMALACGLEAAIMDPLDKELMEAMITSELLLNKSIYCDSFLNAYHK
ncbi:MAG: methyltetrahydrofolate--corrinoid methyltransferase [Candidatus Omnitrophica bacterium CG1_02_49_10]|nr:MAG: methyltetrahydrofolate--corrinoid methyltransferase [Candidatus Omnitrophica bacterium CG1_02_49_10]